MFMTTLLAISFTSIYRGVIGMTTLILIAWLFSSNKKKIDWKLVGKGLLIQIIFAVLVLKVDFVAAGFEFVSKIFTKVIGFTQEGTMFLFQSFISGEIESSLVNFVVMVLPTVVFFSALTSLFYYWGILQKIVYAFAWVMKKAMKLSGAESLAAAGNIFFRANRSTFIGEALFEQNDQFRNDVLNEWRYGNHCWWSFGGLYWFFRWR